MTGEELQALAERDPKTLATVFAATLDDDLSEREQQHKKRLIKIVHDIVEDLKFNGEWDDDDEATP